MLTSIINRASFIISDGFANLEALRNIFAVSERAMFEWIVSRGSMEEAHAKRDPGHMQWLWDIADHSYQRSAWWRMDPRPKARR
jgi:hypothetical protein